MDHEISSSLFSVQLNAQNKGFVYNICLFYPKCIFEMMIPAKKFLCV